MIDWLNSQRAAHRRAAQGIGLVAVLGLFVTPARGDVSVYLSGVPDYQWYSACFGTACGNLIGYWDRHGLPNMYTGPTGGGVAPLDSNGANSSIYSLWVSKAGRDGRPLSMPGHEDDYYVAYESDAPDPYLAAHRPEHTPDCIGDFTGMNQNKWKNLNGECDGNLDAFVFNYWDASGAKRVNFTPGPEAGLPPCDLQSGLRAFAAYRGYQADTFSQLSELNPHTPSGTGFTFADLQAEIDAGYPFLVFLQDPNEMSRWIGSMPRANPEIHGQLVYGYLITDDGTRYARVRNSWAWGDSVFNQWQLTSWVPGYYLTLRGVIAFHPKPQIMNVQRQDGQLVISWHGPAAEVCDAIAGTCAQVHKYVVERATTLSPASFTPVMEPTTDSSATVSDCCPGTAFFRVTLVAGP